jgi:poly-gamma-glutamate capsule biosynthesis protein CapA/YwtB (metallophosphatase superfamily)
MTEITIAVGGDCFPNARFFGGAEPISPAFARTLDLMRAADIRFANFEVPLSDRGRPLDKLAAIRESPEIMEDVGKLGFDVVSLANNHAFDHGWEALEDTLAGLDRVGTRHTGAGASLAAAVEPVILERNGVRVGFLAFSCLVAPGSAATAAGPGIAPIRVHSSYEVNPYWELEEPGEPLMVTIRTRADDDDRRFAEERIRELRPQVDVLCVSVHWGYGASDTLAEYQRPLGHALLDAGADAILGNHVHAVHGIEIHDGKPILYSPGQFVGRQIPVDVSSVSELVAGLIAAMSPDGYLARLAFRDDGPPGVELVPTSLDGNGLPIVAEGAALERIAERVARHSAKLDTELVLRDGALVPAGVAVPA